VTADFRGHRVLRMASPGDLGHMHG
jgi:hypothetical protein